MTGRRTGVSRPSNYVHMQGNRGAHFDSAGSQAIFM